MPNVECRMNDEIRMADCHPERSEAESKDLAKLLFGFATGFLGFARNDGQVIRYSIFRTSFGIRHSDFVIFSSPASLRGGRLESPAENVMAAGTRRRSRHSGACADR